jgi:hypothetical protein
LKKVDKKLTKVEKVEKKLKKVNFLRNAFSRLFVDGAEFELLAALTAAQVLKSDQST